MKKRKSDSSSSPQHSGAVVTLVAARQSIGAGVSWVQIKGINKRTSQAERLSIVKQAVGNIILDEEIILAKARSGQQGKNNSSISFTGCIRIACSGW